MSVLPTPLNPLTLTTSPTTSHVSINPLESLGIDIWHMVHRPVVQGQIAIILLSLLLAYGLTHLFWRWLLKKVPDYYLFLLQNQWRSPLAYSVRLANFVLTPTLNLIALTISHWFYVQQSIFDGLINHAIFLTLLLIIYRIILVVSCIFAPIEKVQYFRRRLFQPLIIYFFIASSFNLLENYELLIRVPLFEVFETPVTIGTILMLTLGIYTWILTALLLEKLVVFYVCQQSRFDAEFIRAFSLLVHYGLVALGVFVILGYVGINPAIFATITGGLSVGVGFGLKEVISNFVSGIWLLVEGALKPGDVINLGGDMSQVEKLGFRAATVKIIRDNSERIIPNQLFFTNEVNTYTGTNHLVYQSITVNTSYRTSPEKVINTLRSIAQAHPAVLVDPKPLIFLLDFGPSSLTFELKFWLDNPLIGKRVSSEIRCAIWETFDQEGIEIPYPQQDIHLKSGVGH